LGAKRGQKACFGAFCRLLAVLGQAELFRCKQKFVSQENFCLKTKIKEIKVESDLENYINSNIDHRHNPAFLFYFKVPPRGLI
jgi:hypothetical protein